MTGSPLGNALRRSLFDLAGMAKLSDGQLLNCFATANDQACFEELVRRHGALVLRVCQRVIRQPQDAEDAFQATFVVLASKAASLSTVTSLAAWLHKVAFRISLNVRTQVNRRRKHEYLDNSTVNQAVRSAGGDDISVRDLGPVLDEEVDRLPEDYRRLVVLCYLQGKTNLEASQQLGWPMGTIASRLSRARDLLRARLTRRGLVFSEVALTAIAAEAVANAAVQRPLFLATVQVVQIVAAGGPVPAPFAALIAIGLRSQIPSRNWLAIAALGLTLLAGGGVLYAARSPSKNPDAVVRQPTEARRPLPTGNILAVNTLTRRVTIATPGALEIWDADPGWSHGGLLFHEQGAGACAAHALPSGILAISYDDGSVRLCDMASRKRLATWSDGPRGKPVLVRVPPGGQPLAIIAPNKGITIWDWQRNWVRGQIALPDRVDARFSPDGAYLMVLHTDTLQLRCWDTVTLKEMPSSVPAGWRVCSLSGDGRSLVVMRSNQLSEVGLLDLATGQVQTQFTVLHRSRLLFHLSPKADTFVYWDESRKVQCVWDVALGKNLMVVKRARPAELCYSESGDSISFSDIEPSSMSELVRDRCFVRLEDLRKRVAHP
ncbi:MAG: sigma-70 family RNA polymerase sigma factor [Planctomycetia bacterium]|nr:sigma-70 family RNA polymerase sigma factor [Planctomycetia bacterium]